MKQRRAIISVITMVLLAISSLWLFTRATEESQETEEVAEVAEKKYYQSYRNNILGTAGDFCVFSYSDASVSEVTADVAVGGNFSSHTFGNYDTNWEFYKENDLKSVNLNSYIRGKYNSGKYGWSANKTQDQLTDTLGNTKGTYDVGNAKGKANLYIYTGDEINKVSQINNNQTRINDVDYENKYRTDEETGISYNAYNIMNVDYDFIDFEKEFQNLSNVSERLMNINEQIHVDCVPSDGGKTYTYNFPQEKDTVVITVDTANFFNKTIYDTFNIDGLDSTKKIIINVNCEGYLGERSPLVKVNGSTTDWNVLAENIVWNYYLPSYIDKTMEVEQAIGTILAPNMNILINGNLNGAVLSRNITAYNAIYGINSNIAWEDIDNPILEKVSRSETKKENDEDTADGNEKVINGNDITNTNVSPVVKDDFVIKINTYKTGTTTKLEGAKFEIVLKDKYGKEVAKKTETTNSTGQIILKDIDIVVGEYSLEIIEKEAPKGHALSKDTIKIEFTVEEKEGKKVIEFKEKYKNTELEKLTITVKVENNEEKISEASKNNTRTSTSSTTTSKEKISGTSKNNAIASSETSSASSKSKLISLQETSSETSTNNTTTSKNNTTTSKNNTTASKNNTTTSKNNTTTSKNNTTASKNNTTTSKKDTTTSKQKLPQTGASNIFVLGVIVATFIVISVIGMIKYREIKF